MVPTLCALCDTDSWDRELYPARLGVNAATSERFSARRLPDRVHYRIVRCAKCGLVRSNPILPEDELARLYAGSALTYAEEAGHARATYGRYLRQCLPLLPARDRLLEIGCGSGFFLEEALICGFAEVCGVEPSRDAADRAAPGLRSCIRNDVFREGIFPPGWFSLVCGFQVLDHLADPNAALRTCKQFLRPGGLALFINHDLGSWTNRILGERSPVVDIQHVCLFSRDTIARLFARSGFEVVRVFSVANTYPLYYWCKLAPLPGALKQRLIPKLQGPRLRRVVLRLRAGNLGIIARRGAG